MKKLWIAIMIVLMLLTEGIVINQHIDYKYTPVGNGTDIFPQFLSGQTGYDYNEENRQFTQVDADPQFYLQGMVSECGGLEITLKEQAQSDIPVQVFYTQTAESGYSEKHSVSTQIKAGESTCYIKTPLEQYQSFRIDMDGNFAIDNIMSYDNTMGKTPLWTEQTTKAAGVALPVIIIFYILLFYAHKCTKQDRSLKDYAKSVFVGETGKARVVSIDYLRVFAAAMIIISHSVSNEMASTPEGSFWRLIFIMILTLGVCSNVIYVMISGRFLLSAKSREEHVSDFYLRRASKVIIPLIAYYIFILYLSGEVSFFPMKNWGVAVKSMLTGAPDVAPHFWLLYTMVALYLATPFFKVCVQNLSDSMLLSLSGVILVMNALTTYLPLAGISFGISTFLAGWEGVFLLGYVLQKDSFAKFDKKIMVAACISYVVSVAIMFKRYDMMNFIYVCAPTTVITTCGIFAFIRQHDRLFSKDGFVLRVCSKYSFSILMIHWYTLFVITEGKLKLSVMRGHVIGGLMATGAVAFVISLGFAIVFDNTVVLILNVLFDQFVNMFKKNHK